MSSAPQPTLAIDDELTLRPFRFADVSRVITAFDDPDIRHWHTRRLDSPTEARESIGYGHILWLREQCANFAVVDATDQLVGRVALYTDLQAGTGEIAYWVLPDARGQRVAARAGAALTTWGHETLGLYRILLEHAVGNLGSCGVARSLGYELEGTARALQLLADGRHDVHLHVHLHTDVNNNNDALTT
jgi:ribosomal-protein-alanine N-acetyltransferase